MLLARLNEILENAETDQELIGLGSKLLRNPSPAFYGFLLAAEWKQKEAYPRFAELLRLALGGGLQAFSRDGARRAGTCGYGRNLRRDASPLFDLLLDDAGDEDIQF